MLHHLGEEHVTLPSTWHGLCGASFDGKSRGFFVVILTGDRHQDHMVSGAHELGNGFLSQCCCGTSTCKQRGQ